MGKFLNDEWVQGMFQGGLYGIGILMVLGAAVNISAFYMGITSAWISLFTYMLMTGAVLFSFLLNILNKKQRLNEKISRHAVLIRIILYMFVMCFIDLRIALASAFLHLLIYFLGNKTVKEMLIPVSHFLILSLSCYGYMKGWIAIAECMLIIMSDHGIYFQEDTDTNALEKKGYEPKSLWKIEHALIPSMFTACLLQCIRYACILCTYGFLEVALIHIANEGELFRTVHVFPYWLGCCAVQIASEFLLRKKIKKIMDKDMEEDADVKIFHACVIPERIAFVIVMTAVALLLLKSSGVLSACLILMCVSFCTVEILVVFSSHTSWSTLRNVRTCLIRIFWIVSIAIAQMLYDGIFVDYSVVLIQMLLFYGLMVCADTWNKEDVLIDRLVSEDEASI